MSFQIKNMDILYRTLPQENLMKKRNFANTKIVRVNLFWKCSKFKRKIREKVRKIQKLLKMGTFRDLQS